MPKSGARLLRRFKPHIPEPAARAVHELDAVRAEAEDIAV
jgi:hypothetical protein